MDDIYKNIEQCNPNKKRKILIVLDDIIADILSNKKREPVVTELFIRRRKLNISLIFIKQSLSLFQKNVKLNLTHFFVMIIPNKRKIQEIAFNHSSYIEFKDLMSFYKKCTAKPYFLVMDTTLP